MSLLVNWICASVRRAGWAPFGVFVVHMLLSNVFQLYGHVPGADSPMHVVGGVAIGWFCWCAMGLDQERALIGALTGFGRAFIAGLGVVAAAVLWEFAEWTTDGLGWTRAQGSVFDTMLDMALGIGAGVATVLVAAFVTATGPGSRAA